MTPGEIQQVLDTLSTVARYGTDSAVCVKASLCIQALLAALADHQEAIEELSERWKTEGRVVDQLRAALAERDAEIERLRTAFAEMPNPQTVAQKFWFQRHAEVIARADKEKAT